MSEVHTPPVVPAVPAATWFSTLEPEIIGHVQNKGWDKLEPAAAAAEMAKAHREAQQLIGVPADQVIKLPKAEDSDGWKKNVWQRLGAPDKPEGYTFEGVKLADDATTAKFIDAMRETAARLNMPKAMAEESAKAFQKYITDASTAESAERTAAVAAERGKLVENWGPETEQRFKTNMFLADQGAARLGVTPEVMQSLVGGIGGAAVAEMFMKIARGFGEDKFINPGGEGGTDQMSREQAVARMADLEKDTAWVKRYQSGDAAARREMEALIRIKIGV